MPTAQGAETFCISCVVAWTSPPWTLRSKPWSTFALWRSGWLQSAAGEFPRGAGGGPILSRHQLRRRPEQRRDLLLALTHELGRVLADPLKTTNVQNLWCMTNWVVLKSERKDQPQLQERCDGWNGFFVPGALPGA